ncbi:MAG: cytochrome c oxidase assembly protein, partial [Candidatus Dormibacteraeota bacterium]|nr:cytochrome c oxidase assembly protein [Candidatus Dormibacteraeota bacterium]
PIRGPETTPVSPLVKIAAMVLAGIPPTVLGLIFAISPVAFYSFYVNAPRLWGVSAVADQSYGGVLMLGLGNIIYFVAITIIFVRLLGDSAHDEEEAAALLRPAAATETDVAQGVSPASSRTMNAAVTAGTGTASARQVGAAPEGGSR